MTYGVDNCATINFLVRDSQVSLIEHLGSFCHQGSLLRDQQCLCGKVIVISCKGPMRCKLCVSFLVPDFRVCLIKSIVGSCVFSIGEKRVPCGSGQ